jgi:SAM-dependent methyltransferase
MVERRETSERVPWWHPEGGFFGDLYMEADNSLQTFFAGSDRLDARTGLEVSGVVRLGGLQPGDRVVDCPCGYGRHSIELARRGYDVTGIDINPRFLGLARAAARRADAVVSFVPGDMRRLPDVASVDAVINMFYSFGFFTPSEDLDVLRGFHRALRPGGRFLMHTMITTPAFEDGRIPREERRMLGTGRTLVSRRHFDTETKREMGRWSIVAADGTVREMAPYDVRIYTAGEFAELCRAAGFGEVALFGDWDGRPYDDASPYLIAVATK